MSFADKPVVRQASTLELALAHHGAGRLDEAAAIYHELLEGQPAHAVALNLLGNVQYQTGHTAQALSTIQKAIDIEPSCAVHRVSLGHVHRKLQDLSRAAASYSSALALAPDSILAASCLADALRGLGDLDGAATALRQLLLVAPAQAEALLRLGEVYLELGQPSKASNVLQRCLAVDPGSADVRFKLGVAARQDGNTEFAVRAFSDALGLDPAHAASMYNLGVIEFERQDINAAQGWFRRAIAVAPDYVDAHINLSAVLLRGGEVAQARVHRDIAYRTQCIFVRASRAAVRTVLILFEAGHGNINLSHLFSRSRNTIVDWMIEYASPEQARNLPHFDLVFNAMGDPDLAGAQAAQQARGFVTGCDKPVLNAPEAVARTSREKIPELLSGIEGLFVPRVWRVSPAAPWPAEIFEHLPLLVRPVDSHGGAGLRRISSREELEQLMVASRQALYVSTYCDYVSGDGFHRKYRMVFVDRQPLPYHLAISKSWLVHYATSDMPSHPWKLEEERRFLESPQSTLGATAYAAVASIGERMNLAYAGVDFSVLADGRVLVFEANPVMLVHPEEPTGALAFKNMHVTRIFDAFEALLTRMSPTSEKRA